jgi:hypothetical protein
MRQSRILRIFGIVLVLSLLFLAVPAVPAMAVNDVTMSPVSGKIGDAVYVTGTNFNTYIPDATYDYYANIYFSKDNATKNTPFAANVHTYNLVDYVPIYDNGSGVGVFDGAFVIPASLTEGSVDANVTSGTYYVYVTVTRVLIASPYTETTFTGILGKSPAFTITASAALDPLSPATGSVGTDINISGANFPASTALVFKFDTTTIAPKSGDTSTRTSGIFISTITVPAGATVGAHTVTVTAGTGTATATFNVTASAALDPLSPATGPAGIEVNIVGSNFPASTALVFRFDATVIAPKAGTDAATRSNGIFISTITVPAGTTAGAHTITVTAGTGTANATFTVTATAALEPLSPASGPAGTDVIVSGANLLASYPIIFKLDTTTLTPKSGDTSTTIAGSFYSTITIPSGTIAGAHTISVTVGTTVLTATFTVTGAPTPTPTPTSTQTYINVVQNEFNVGSPIGIGGSGFTPGATVTIKYAGVTKATAVVNADTTFSVIFEVPALQAGARQFTISDGTNTTTANFVVETTAPTVPEEITPEDGTKTKIPITFDWEDVTDASAPVTYDFQLATDENFTADSIVLEKKALTESKFILTEAEGLDLASEQTPYYWRVKSVDGALNESNWTAAGDFFTSGPSPFPTWATIVIGVFGGLFLLILGFWIGRRTAFYY